MPPNLDQFVKLADAPELFNVSMTTLRRKRTKARQTDDSDTYGHFIVKTRDGEIYEQPLPELINQLIKDGKLPEWLVEHNWLSSQYGARKKQDNTDQPPNTVLEQSSPPSKEQPDHSNEQGRITRTTLEEKLIASYEARLKDQADRYREQVDLLKEQLDKSQLREIKITEKLDRILPAQAGSTTVDTTPTPQPVTQNPRPKSETKIDPKRGSTTAKSKTQKQPAKEAVSTSPSRLRRFFFGNK